ncbi:MAG: disulfide bond formation protein DsbA [Chthoniobacterales bacterium]|nr:MAG: disulfide bond formation protein DsbA [Chthoniobacterales bacterium]
MNLKVTIYLDVISSWCFWAQPAWEELKKRYADRVDFDWKIALMDASGFPKSIEQAEWFYQRSGMMMRSPFMLKPGWFEPDLQECLAPNLVAEAARDFGVADDRVRMALANATERDGIRTGNWEVAAEIGAKAAGLDKTKLLERARSPEVEARARASTAEFHALQVSQRPTFVIDTEIGDRAIFSGFAKPEPIASTLDAMLDDLAAYESHRAHFGEPPPA